MPRKFSSKSIRNKDAEVTVIRLALPIEKFKTEISLQNIRLEKYRGQFSKIVTITIKKFTTNYSNNICDTSLNHWESDCKREEDKSKAVFKRKKDSHLNNATTKFHNKDRDETNPEKKRKISKSYYKIF